MRVLSFEAVFPLVSSVNLIYYFTAQWTWITSLLSLFLQSTDQTEARTKVSVWEGKWKEKPAPRRPIMWEAEEVTTANGKTKTNHFKSKSFRLFQQAKYYLNSNATLLHIALVVHTEPEPSSTRLKNQNTPMCFSARTCRTPTNCFAAFDKSCSVYYTGNTRKTQIPLKHVGWSFSCIIHHRGATVPQEGDVWLNISISELNLEFIVLHSWFGKKKCFTCNIQGGPIFNSCFLPALCAG